MGKSRVLVTGGAGRLGRLVLAELISAGYEVSSFDLAAPAGFDCESDIGNLADLAAVESALAGVDAVCHIGAIPGEKGFEPPQIFESNVRGTFNVLEAAHRQGVQRIVFASSIVVYGASAMWGQPAYLPIDESHPCAPVTTYAMSKLNGETYCRGYTLRYGLETACLRLANFTRGDHIFQPDDDPKEFAASIYGGKVAGSDVAQAFRLALEADIKHEAFNIVSRHRYAENGQIDAGGDVMKRAREICAGKIDPSIAEGRESFSCEKAVRILGYQPSW
jgi:nucleoside-diphosphate-sugar epimerase